MKMLKDINCIIGKINTFFWFNVCTASNIKPESNSQSYKIILLKFTVLVILELSKDLFVCELSL